MSPKFSIKAMLILLFVASLIVAGISNSNRWWNMILSGCFVVAIILLTATAIGSTGRLRLQSISFVVLSIAFLVGIQINPNLSLYKGVHTNLREFANWSGCASNSSKSPQGWELFYSDNEYQVDRNDGKNWVSISHDEVKRLKLEPYVYSSFTSPSYKHFEEIALTIIGKLVGMIAFWVTGIAFDRRPED